MQDRMTRTRMWAKYRAEPNPGIIFQAIADDMIVATSSKKHPAPSQTGVLISRSEGLWTPTFYQEARYPPKSDFLRTSAGIGKA